MAKFTKEELMIVMENNVYQIVNALEALGMGDLEVIKGKYSGGFYVTCNGKQLFTAKSLAGGSSRHPSGYYTGRISMCDLGYYHQIKFWRGVKENFDSDLFAEVAFKHYSDFLEYEKRQAEEDALKARAQDFLDDYPDTPWGYSVKASYLGDRPMLSVNIRLSQYSNNTHLAQELADMLLNGGVEIRGDVSLENIGNLSNIMKEIK